MGFFDTFIGGALQFGSNQFNARQQYEYQRLLNQQAYELTQQSYREAPLNQRIGLENAGYNPILAVQNGISNASFSGGSATAPAPTDFANAYRAFKLENSKNKAEIDNLKSSTNATNASTSLIQEQAKSEQYRQKQMEAQTILTDLQSFAQNKENSWIDRKRAMEVATGYISAEAAHLNSEANQLNAHTAQSDYRLRKGITDYENVQRKAVAEFYKKHPIQKSLTTGIGEWTGAFGNIFKGNYSLNRR